MSGSEYWLISAPGDKTLQQTWDTLQNGTVKPNLSANYKFHIPDLKVGTLDQLVGLSDDLAKLDIFVESVTRKIAQYLAEVLEDQRDKLHENLMANNTGTTSRSSSQGSEAGEGGCSCAASPRPPSAPPEPPPGSPATPGSHVSSATPNSSVPSDDGDEWPLQEQLVLSQGDLPSYVTRFQWDMAKYPIKQSLRNIADIINKQVAQIDVELKTKSAAYNALKSTLLNLEKKQTGSLLTRNLADLVKKEHFIQDSEYLQTLLVIVPKSQFNEWMATYEKLTPMVVPRSSQMVHQDGDYGLYTVTLFKKVIEEFKLHAREHKFIVRDFSYNESEMAAGKNEMTKLLTDKKKQFGPLVRWLKVNFSECFCAWIHVKALRVFVESVLRYGLPVNFLAVVMVPAKRQVKKLRDVLHNMYAHLDASSQGGGGGASDNVEIAGLGLMHQDYYPYVFYKLNIDMIEKA